MRKTPNYIQELGYEGGGLGRSEALRITRNALEDHTFGAASVQNKRTRLPGGLPAKMKSQFRLGCI